MFYAYILSDKKGIVEDWESCKALVNGVSGAKFKKFKTLVEANAFINNENIELEDAIYFDAGTGRGRGVEVRITDKNKNSLIPVLKENRKDIIDFFNKKGWNINEFSNIELGNNYTNNFGELLGCYVALIIANIRGENKIFGDSNLVIDYWSKEICNIEDKETLKLVEVVSKLRNNFNGKIEHISGDINPADLGFHK
jgi:caulimovirus viroplasmin